MKSIELNLKTITPLFLGGADGKAVELRAPSIKGLMRFWWRAARGLNDIKELQKEEAEIFGSSDEKYGKSKFSIKINIDNWENNFTYQYKPLPHHTGNNNCPFCNNKCKKSFPLRAIKVGKSFNIILSTIYDNRINYFLSILEMSLLLGGLGKRSRRGFGSVHCSNWNFQDNNSLINYILQRLNSVNENDFKINNGEIIRVSNPTSKYPFIKEIRLGRNYNDYNDLLKTIGQATHKDNDPSLGYAGKFPKNSNNTIRMSSPVYVSIIKINNQFIPVITTLNSAFPKLYPNYDIKKQDSFKSKL